MLHYNLRYSPVNRGMPPDMLFNFHIIKSKWLHLLRFGRIFAGHDTVILALGGGDRLIGGGVEHINLRFDQETTVEEPVLEL